MDRATLIVSDDLSMQEKMRRFYREAAAAFACYHRAKMLRLTPALTDSDMLIFERIGQTEKFRPMPYVVGICDPETAVDVPWELEPTEAHCQITFKVFDSHWNPISRLLVHAHVMHTDPSRHLAYATMMRLKGCFSVGVVDEFSQGFSYCGPDIPHWLRACGNTWHQ